MSRLKDMSTSLAAALVLAALIFGCASVAQAQTGDIYSLPSVSVGDKYEYTIPVVGVRPVKWEVVKGDLPPGIDLGRTTGTLFGWPSVAETKAYLFTVKLTDTSNKAIEYQLELVVEGGAPALLLPRKGEGPAQVGGVSGRPASSRPGSPAVTRGGTTKRAQTAAATTATGGKQGDDTDGDDEDAKKPIIDHPLTAGLAEVRGFVPAEGVKHVTVSVSPSAPENAKLLPVGRASVGSNGRFSFALERPLVRGQKVQAEIELPPAEAGADPTKLVSDAVVVERETTVQTVLAEGVKEIKGTADLNAKQVFAEARDGERWKQIGAGRVDPETGEFTIRLTNALTREDRAVRVSREGGAHVELSVAPSGPPALKPSLLEGARTVSGYLLENRSAKVEVEVLPDTGSESPLHRTEATAVNAGTGEFTVALPHSLVAGQRVRARVENTDTWSEPQVVETLGDWGRVRAYFGIGMTLSKEAASFSRRDLHLNFNIDSNWYHRPRYTTVLKESEQMFLVSSALSRFQLDAAEKDSAAAAVEVEREKLESALKALEGFTSFSAEERMTARRDLILKSLKSLEGNKLLTDDRRELIQDAIKKLERRGTGRWDIHFNTFFDTRLTPVPISGQTSSSGLGADAFGNFVTNEKGALIQVGAYAPIFNHGSMTWNYQGNQNAVFFGPIGRAGVQTIFDKGNLADPSVFADNDLFNFFALGLRFGHYKLSGSDDRAPQLISYLDITRGRWQNLERRVPTGDRLPNGDEIFVRTRPLRWALEGRLKIPAMPLLIGFDSNVGEGPDDLRFLFGTTFDVAQLFNLLR